MKTKIWICRKKFMCGEGLVAFTNSDTHFIFHVNGNFCLYIYRGKKIYIVIKDLKREVCISVGKVGGGGGGGGTRREREWLRKRLFIFSFKLASSFFPLSFSLQKRVLNTLEWNTSCRHFLKLLSVSPLPHFIFSFVSSPHVVCYC